MNSRFWDWLPSPSWRISFVGMTMCSVRGAMNSLTVYLYFVKICGIDIAQCTSTSLLGLIGP